MERRLTISGSYAYQLGSALPDVGPGESTRLGVWVLDGDPVYARMMRFALGQTVDALDRSVVLLCASMAEPWLLFDALNNWAAMLNDQIAHSGAFDERVLREARDRRKSRASWWRPRILTDFYLPPSCPPNCIVAENRIDTLRYAALRFIIRYNGLKYFSTLVYLFF